MSALPNLRSDLVAGIVRRRLRRRRVARAGTVGITVAAVTVFALLPVGSGRSPAQALAQAAQQTADFTSGRIEWTITRAPPTTGEDGSTLRRSTTKVRYQGNDLASDSQLTLIRNGATESRSASARLVDGKLYTSIDGARTLNAATIVDDGRTPLGRHAHALNSLAAVVRASRDVTAQTSDGMTTYTATIDDLNRLMIPVGDVIVNGGPATKAPPPPSYLLPVGSPNDAVTLTVVVKDDVVRSLTATQPEAGFTAHAEISDLGKPQDINAP